MASESSRSSSMRNVSQSGLASSLFISGLVLLGTFANILVFSAFPLQALRPEWQLRMAGFLIANGITALLGVLFVSLSEQGLSASKSPFLGRALLIRRLAGWAAIGYIILIPLQITAGLRQLTTIAEAEKQPGIQWGKFRVRINATETEAELRALLNQIPEMPPFPDKIPGSLAALKTNLITDLDARFAARTTQLEKARSERLQNFLGEAIRNTIQCLLLAAGFSAASSSNRLSGLGRSPANLIP